MSTYQEALTASLEYFGGEDLPAKVFADKYALQDNDGNFLELTPDDMHRRLAKEFARIEKKKFKSPMNEEDIYNHLKNYERIIPQGSPIYAIGNKYKYVSASNCFVVDGPYDSYGGICKTDQEIANISKRRGGIGYDISRLRPAKERVNNAAHTTTGSISFMHRFSNTGREVGQGGRRAAQMISMSIHHPDILEFATIKNDENNVTGANISIRLTDEFLNAVKNKTTYEQRWPVDELEPKISKQVDAVKVWNTIIHSAWLRGEPGLLMWDNIIRESPADCYSSLGFKTVSTNPCGEVPLSSGDSCRLLAINLMYHVKDPFTTNAYFDYKLFSSSVKISQRLMDDLIDLEEEHIQKIIDKIENDPEPSEIKKSELDLWYNILDACRAGRRTGLGITALGDTLAALGIKYGTKKSIEEINKIYKTLKLEAYRESVQIAKEIGPFPVWNHNLEKECPFLLRIKDEDEALWEDMKKYGRRNIAILTTAPTGTVSTQASYVINEKRYFNTTSGIEPAFLLSYTRRKKGNPDDNDFRVDFIDKLGDTWMEFTVYHSGIRAWMDVTGETDIEKSPYWEACANDINWKNRVKLQSTAQKHIDHAISSTVNLPNDVSKEEVAEIYTTAHQCGCKGITVYRDGCRSGVLVSTKNKKFPEKRPRELDCDIHHVSVKGQHYFVMVGKIEDKPYEVFAGKNGFMDKNVKTGKIIRKKADFYKAELDNDEELAPITAAMDEEEEVISRLTSTLLRSGANMHLIVQQLEKTGERQSDLNCFSRGVARALKKYIENGTKEGKKCPQCDCKDTLIRQEGCISCSSCGFSKCS